MHLEIQAPDGIAFCLVILAACLGACACCCSCLASCSQQDNDYNLLTSPSSTLAAADSLQDATATGKCSGLGLQKAAPVALVLAIAILFLAVLSSWFNGEEQVLPLLLAPYDKGLQYSPDGLNPVPVNVTYQKNGFPFELWLSTRVASNNITVNSTHFYIPFRAFVQSDYYFRKANEDREDAIEYGTALWWPSINELCLYSYNVTVGFVGKFHAVHSQNHPPNLKASRVRASRETQTPLSRWLAEWLGPLRRVLILGLFSVMQLNTAFTQLSAMNSKSHEPIWEFSQTDAGQSSQYLKDRSSHGQSMLSDTFANTSLNVASPILSYVTCYHFASPDYDENGVWFEFGKKYMSFKGHDHLTPFYSINAFGGTTVFSYNSEMHSIESYYGASIFSHWGDPWADTSPYRLVLSPADGQTMEIPAPENLMPVKPSLFNHLLYNFVEMLPEDYNYMFPVPGLVPGDACSDEDWDDLHNFFVGTYAQTIKSSDDDLSKPSLSDLLRLAYWLPRYVSCARAYFRPAEIHTGLTGEDLYAVAGFFHTLYEIPPENMMPSIATNRWNEIHPRQALI